ncbi:MAG: dihydrofolate reductase family protein, partial [Actinomycetes bacterium]
VDANLRLGLPVDARDYGDAAAVLTALGVRSVRLLSNNPDKVDGLRRLGVNVESVIPLATAPQVRNLRYLRTKADRLGHMRPTGQQLVDVPDAPVDVSRLLGPVRPRPDRPYVLVKYAQSIDGRIATRTGDSKWISGEAERRVAHGLRAACDAVLVGSGTVQADDPQLTVRLVPGANPIRVVVDSTLRTAPEAHVLSDDAATVVFTTAGAEPGRREQLRSAGIAVREVTENGRGLDLAEVLADLRRSGVQSLLVEGGAGVIASLFAAGLVDRLVVSVSPVVLGQGVEAVGDLGSDRVTDGIRLSNRSVYVTDSDVLLAWDVEPRA